MLENMEGMTLLTHDYYSGFQEYEVTVIKDTKTLNKLYSQINKTRKPGLPVPMVDFTENQVIMLCLGKLQGEKTPVLAKSEETEDHLLVTVSLMAEKEGNQADTSIVSYPFYIYKMPYTSKTMDFKKVDW